MGGDNSPCLSPRPFIYGTYVWLNLTLLQGQWQPLKRSIFAHFWPILKFHQIDNVWLICIIDIYHSLQLAKNFTLNLFI